MKITRLSITNYKSFSTSDNPVEDEIPGFKNMNMIYGYNNSGKSNLLKFIHLIFQPKLSTREIVVEGERMETDQETTFWRGPIINSPFIFHKNNRDKPITFKLTVQVNHLEIKNSGFSQYDELSNLFSRTHAYATFSFKGEIRKIDNYDTSEVVLLSSTLNNKVIYSLDESRRAVYFEGATTNSSLRSDSTAFTNLLSFFNSAALFLDNNRYFVTEYNIKQTQTFSAPTFKKWLYQLSINPKLNEIFDKLNAFIKKHKILPNSANATDNTFTATEKNSPLSNFSPEFAINEDDSLEIMFKRGSHRFPLSSFGTGIQQILFILTALFTSNAKIILIEELELNLSPRYQSELFKILLALIEDGKIDQVFFTTHSKYFNNRTDFSIYEVVIDAHGVSKVSKVNKSKKEIFFRNIE